jgi:hypothetical protein
VQIRGNDLTFAPVSIQETAESRLVHVTNGEDVIDPIQNAQKVGEQNIPQYSRFSINGQPAKVIYNDGKRMVFGNSDSVYEKNGDSEVAVGVIIVE